MYKISDILHLTIEKIFSLEYYRSLYENIAKAYHSVKSFFANLLFILKKLPTQSKITLSVGYMMIGIRLYLYQNQVRTLNLIISELYDSKYTGMINKIRQLGIYYLGASLFLHLGNFVINIAHMQWLQSIQQLFSGDAKSGQLRFMTQSNINSQKFIDDADNTIQFILYRLFNTLTSIATLAINAHALVAFISLHATGPITIPVILLITTPILIHIIINKYTSNDGLESQENTVKEQQLRNQLNFIMSPETRHLHTTVETRNRMSQRLRGAIEQSRNAFLSLIGVNIKAFIGGRIARALSLIGTVVLLLLFGINGLFPAIMLQSIYKQVSELLNLLTPVYYNIFSGTQEYNFLTSLVHEFKKIKVAQEVSAYKIDELTESDKEEHVFASFKDVIVQATDPHDKEITLLRIDNLTLYSNCKYLVVGPTGAGKSTFFDLLSGMLPAMSEHSQKLEIPYVSGGTIRADLSNQYLIRQKASYPAHTISTMRQFMCYPVPVEAVADGAAEEYMDAYAALRSKKGSLDESPFDPTQHSGGEGQRLKNFSIFCHPDHTSPDTIFLLDEVCSHLDRQTEQEFYNYFDKKHHGCFLEISHNFDKCNPPENARYTHVLEFVEHNGVMSIKPYQYHEYLRQAVMQ